MFRSLLFALAILLWPESADAEVKPGWAMYGSVSLAYWVQGADDGVPIVIINGQGAASRPGDPMATALATKGFRVILFDNRDSGRSTILRDAGAPPSMEQIVAAVEAGEAPAVAYDLSDMADDAIAVLDATGIDRAHVLGHSLGGMIAQVLTAEHPDRVLSLISVSSTSGEPGLPFGPAMAALSEPPVDPQESPVDQQARIYRIFDGSVYQLSDGEVVERVMADMGTDDPYAAARQGAAVLATGDRRALLEGISLPALVIHGGGDPWFPIVHAESTADALGEAEVEVIDGLGHILTDAAAGTVAERISSFVRSLPPR